MSGLLLKDLSSFVLLPAESVDHLTVIPNNVCVCLCVCAGVITLIVVCEREGRVRISAPLSCRAKVCIRTSWELVTRCHTKSEKSRRFLVAQ